MKTIIQKLFGSIGYRISRLERTSNENADKTTTGGLRFGSYEIRCDCIPVIDNYANNPNVNQFLARLAGCLNESKEKLGIIDVGANCGDTAALMRSQTKLPILCIEGDSKLYSLLKTNMLQCSDITLLNSYVGEVTGPMSVKIEKEGWNNTLIPSEKPDSIIQITRLDELSHPWLAQRKIGLLKVDAEGFDVAILIGAKNLLAASKPIVTFEYNRENMDAISEPGLRVFPYLDSLDYEGLLIFESTGRYLMSTTVQDTDLLIELHNFIRPPTCGLHYLDIVAFPKNETALFRKFRNSERAR